MRLVVWVVLGAPHSHTRAAQTEYTQTQWHTWLKGTGAVWAEHLATQCSLAPTPLCVRLGVESSGFAQGSEGVSGAVWALTEQPS